MCTTFDPVCRNDKSSNFHFVLSIVQKKCVLAILLEKKTFMFPDTSDCQCQQCSSTCQFRIFPCEKPKTSFLVFLCEKLKTSFFYQKPKDLHFWKLSKFSWRHFGDVSCPGKDCARKNVSSSMHRKRTPEVATIAYKTRLVAINREVILNSKGR